MVQVRMIVIAAIVVTILASGIYASSFLSSSTSDSKSSTASWVTTSETTVEQTTNSSCSSASSSISSTTVSSSSAVTSNTTNASFTYSPQSPIEIQSVQAIVETNAQGQEYVTFSVSFIDSATYNVFLIGGCGSGLTSTILNGSAIQKTFRAVNCMCPDYIISLQPGQNHTSTNPGCWSGYWYNLVSPGKVVVQFLQQWSTGSSGFQNASSTSIVATFTFN